MTEDDAPTVRRSAGEFGGAPARSSDDVVEATSADGDDASRDDPGGSDSGDRKDGSGSDQDPADETGNGATGDSAEEAGDHAAGDSAEEAGDHATGDRPAGATTVEASRLSSTDHWLGIAAVTFLTAGLGVLTQSRPLFLAAVVGVGYLAYANATEAPEPSLAVTRAVTDPNPEPGDRVGVRVTVTNAGDGVLPDLRIVDHVPDALAAVDGPARTATALRPGASVTFAYTVLARRGEFTFDGLDVVARNVSGSRERALELRTEPTTITCLPPLDATETVPLHGLTSPYTGRVSTDSAGEGVEFASLREYQHGDALSRIDWNRYARDGDLATMEFREERMATVVVLVELRKAAYLQAGPDGPHAVDRSIEATRRLFNSLIDTGDRVGVATLAPDDVWQAPGAGPTHQAEVRNLLATHPTLSPTPPSDRVYVPGYLRTFLHRLADDAQVVFVSPVPDRTSEYVARAIHVRDHPVTVISPDSTRTDTPGRTLAAAERSNRLASLRESGLRVVDWDPEESLAEALARGRRRWSG